MKKFNLFLYTLLLFANISFAKHLNSPLLAPFGIPKVTNSVDHGIPNNSNISVPLPPSKRLLDHATKWKSEPPPLENISLGACSAEMYAITTPAALVNYLKTHNYDNCVSDLWTYTADSKKIFTVSNLTAVLNETTKVASNYDGTNKDHIKELIFFVRVAFYQNYYHPLDFNIQAVKPLVISTANSLFQNTRLYDNTSLAGDILGHFVNLIDAAGVINSTSGGMEKILNIFINDLSRLNIYNEANALYYTFFTWSRAMGYQITNVTPNFINVLKRFACLKLSRDDQWVANWGSWLLGDVYSKIPAAKIAAFAALESAYYLQDKWTGTWVNIIKSLTRNADCVTLSTNEKVCQSIVKKNLKARLFPTVYTFENNAMRVNTALSFSTVEPLYYASKEEQAQLGRIIKKLTPVKNDPNATLNIYLYATRSDYEDFASFLFDLSSDNGGIYIEQNGTFYTYQRTPQESIYSLQELFRHEYTHYLIGRYLVEGMWGEVPIYDNGRMVSFDEGMAEFVAGTTIRDDIALRATIVRQIKNINKANRLSVGQIIWGDYNTPNIYLFGCMFWHFMYTKHIDQLQKYTDLIYTNNITGMDAMRAQWRADANLNMEYQVYLDDAIAKLNTLSTPTTFAPLDSDLIYSKPEQIKALINKTQMMNNTSCVLPSLSAPNFFTCQGIITGSSMNTKNNFAAWYNLDKQVNLFQKILVSNNVKTNLNWTACRFEEPQWTVSNTSFIPFAKTICTGPLGKGSLMLTASPWR